MRALPLIVHLDADAFFVSVEQALNPSLRGKKCAVGGRERGIISSASYEARAVGVYTPMPTAQAVRVCPDLILISHSLGNYGQVSRQMFDICETITPIVQRNSIDEGYLDLSLCGYKSCEEIEKVVRSLQAKIWAEIQIPVSMGMATNKTVAQIASKLRKPRGFVIVAPGTEAEFLAPLSVGKLPGVGAKTEQLLAEQGILTIRDLLVLSEARLAALLGNGWRGLLALARGEDDRPIETLEEDAKSYSQQETFMKDIGDFATIENVAKGMLDELMTKVRRDGKRVKTLTVKVRYPNFTQETQGRSLEEATEIEAPFYPVLSQCLEKAWSKKSPLRLVSVRLSGVENLCAQLEMFGLADERRRKLSAVMDKLNKGGIRAVQHGHQLAKRKAPL